MSRIIVLGGTGTLGTALTRELIKNRENSITCLSRGEPKQKEMAEEFKHDPRIRFVIGDIRDREFLLDLLSGFDVCFHVAALKHVDLSIPNSREFVKTDVLGTWNVVDSAIRNKVKYVVFSSTDKAVDPANPYGNCKALSEVDLFNANRQQDVTRFSVFRWGNILGSQGSVLSSMKESILANGSYKLTHPEMTRFFLRIETAVKFMLDHYENAPKDRVLIPSFKSAKLTEVASVVAEIVGMAEPTPIDIGMRPGEKKHEVLSSLHTPMKVLSSEDNLMTRDELKTLIEPVLRAI